MRAYSPPGRCPDAPRSPAPARGAHLIRRARPRTGWPARGAATRRRCGRCLRRSPRSTRSCPPGFTMKLPRSARPPPRCTRRRCRPACAWGRPASDGRFLMFSGSVVPRPLCAKCVSHVPRRSRSSPPGSLVVQRAEVFQLRRAHEREVGRVEEEHAPLPQHVVLRHRFEVVVMERLDGEVVDFLVDHGHSCCSYLLKTLPAGSVFAKLLSKANFLIIATHKLSYSNVSGQSPKARRLSEAVRWKVCHILDKFRPPEARRWHTKPASRETRAAKSAPLAAIRYSPSRRNHPSYE